MDIRKSRLPRLATNLAMGIGAVLIGLLVCELVLRLVGVGYPVYMWTDPLVGVAHIPGVRSRRESEGQPWIRINRDGLRGPETTLDPPPDTYRIALLGDSFIEALEVPYQNTVGEVIARRLSALRGAPVEVLNFGVGGYGTTQELLTLQHKVWRYSPDLVLLAVTTGNDISDNYRPLKHSEYVPYHVYHGDSLVLDSTFLDARGYRRRAVWTRRLLTVVQHSRVAQIVNRARHLWRKSERQRENAGDVPEDELGLRDEVHLPPGTPAWREAWRVTEGLLQMMRDECRARSTRFAVVTLTRGIQVTPEREKKKSFLRRLGAKDLYYAERRLAALGEREGIPILNLAPTMASQAEKRQVYFHAYGEVPGIGHWNEQGHRTAGKLIAAWLAEAITPRGPGPSPRQALATPPPAP